MYFCVFVILLRKNRISNCWYFNDVFISKNSKQTDSSPDAKKSIHRLLTLMTLMMQSFLWRICNAHVLKILNGSMFLRNI